MRYIKFAAGDDVAINQFLEEQGDKIDNNGVRLVGDNVCILYSELTDEQYLKKATIAGLQTSKFQLVGQLAMSKQKELFFRDCAVKEGKKAKDGPNFGDLVVNEANEQKRMLAEIHFFNETIHLIESDSDSIQLDA